jgi:hypothetical protein
LVFKNIETLFQYPFIAKPVDDGCSSAVRKIKNRAELTAFSTLIFRDEINLVAFSDEKYDLIFHLAAWTQAGDLWTRNVIVLNSPFTWRPADGPMPPALEAWIADR